MFSDGDLSRVINKDKLNLKPLVNELYIEHGFADVIKTPGINPTMEDYYFSKGKREMTLLFQVCDTAGFNFRANIDKLYGQPDKLNLEIGDILAVLRKQSVEIREKSKRSGKKTKAKKNVIVTAVRMTKGTHTLANRSRQKPQPGFSPMLPIQNWNIKLYTFILCIE